MYLAWGKKCIPNFGLENFGTEITGKERDGDG
jgi:hypothetical protein